MGFFATALDLTLAGLLIAGGALGVVFLALFGIIVKVLPFMLKLGAVALLAYFGLGLLGII